MPTIPPPHIFVDISSHGLGHLAQVAPILNALVQQQPELQLTIRSGLPPARLQARIHAPFAHIAASSDFGFVMIDAVRIDYAATARRYRDFHANWPQRVAEEAALLRRLRPDLVLTDVAYLPLAGAAQASIPSLAMSSLNWADLFQHTFGHEAWAAPIHAEILAAYRRAECFLRLTPAMPMPDLPRTRAIAPVAAIGQNRRAELCEKLGCAPDDKLVLVAFGGFDKALAAERWPTTAKLRWLVPQSWPVNRPDMTAFEPLGLSFSDLLCSVDAVLTKPGYGTFTEAACNGTPVLYLRRDDWPEQDCLIAWLEKHGRCREVTEETLLSHDFAATLAALWHPADRPAPLADGARQAATLIRDRWLSSARA